MPSPITAEIIAIGTEVVMGEVVNSNASWISQQLAELGIDVYFHTAVGDNPKRIHHVLQQAFSRSNLLIFTGGLGPTDDDLTIATLAEFFDAPLQRDETIAQNLRDFFAARKVVMSETNLKQADKPETAEFLNNALGTAPGQYWDVSSYCAEKGLGKGPQIAITLPGVPSEMKRIWADEVVSKLKSQFQIDSQLYSCSLKFFGLGESALAESIRDLMQHTSPSVATYVGQSEVRVRVAAKAQSEVKAQAILEPTKQVIIQRLKDYYYGEGDVTLEQVVVNALASKEWRVATAESCTGGLVSSRLTDVPGSSAVVHYNAVTYSNQAKVDTLGVSPQTLAQHGAVSEAVAIEMADGIRQKTGAHFGVGITGIAGPDGGSDDKPVGLAYVAISSAFGPTQTHQVLANKRFNRERIKHWFSQYALYALHQAIK